jgi:Rrf2 family protein
MKISTRARYGTRLMLELALHYDERPLFLKDIAKAEEISEKYLSQIIIPLRSAGLVNSFRGAHGGYVLARPPAKITLKDIVGVLEGGFDLVSCLEDTSACSRVSICVTRDIWRNLGDKIAKTLESTTLEDLVKQCKTTKKTALMYNI